MTTPFFSIVIPTYNRGPLVMKAIESVFAQDFSDFEVIVVNDGGKDDTGERIKSITDPRFQYFYKENGERAAARNYGANKAKGRYINFFDSDDLLYPNHLSTAKALIERENSPEFFHLGYDFRIDSGDLVRKVDNLDETIQRKAMFDNFLSCNGVFVRKDITQAYPFEEERVLASAEDWALWVRLLSRFRIRYSNTITSTVLTHDQRSIHTIPTDKVIRRDDFLIHYLRKDDKVMDSFGYFGWKKFEAQRHTFVMLCLAEDGRYKEVLRWAGKAFATYPLILFSSRFLVSCRKAILKR